MCRELYAALYIIDLAHLERINYKRGKKFPKIFKAMRKSLTDKVEFRWYTFLAKTTPKIVTLVLANLWIAKLSKLKKDLKYFSHQN